MAERHTIRVESIGAAGRDGRVQLRVFCESLGIKKFSMPLFVPGQVAQYWLAGNEYEAMLERGNAKQGKQGSQYASDYYWNYVGEPTNSDLPHAPQQELDFVERPDGSPPPPRQQAAQQQPARSGGYVSDRDRNLSIVRQVAAKAAVDLLTHYPPDDPSDVLGAFTVYADHVAAWIINEAVEATE